MTSQPQNAQGQPLTAASGEVAHDFDLTVAAYLGARADSRERLAAVLLADPACVLGHCLDGYLSMLSGNAAAIRDARGAAGRARMAGSRTRMTPREELHCAALEAWSHGDMSGAADRWDVVLAAYPHDLLALRVSQFVLSYLGESERMRGTVARVLPAWSAGVPGYGFVLGCYAYGLEESGQYALAEEMGRRAVELNPEDIWAAHAVAHVREMEGRLREGIDWISTCAGHWSGCTNFARHLRWHEALYRLELEQYAGVLELYDQRVRLERDDEYLDVTNAVSLLWRLEQAEVDVGQRWRELAACAGAHLDDHALVFADLHYLTALAAAGDAGAVERFLASCSRYAAEEQGTEAKVMARVGLPLARAVVAHRRGAFGEVVDLLLPVRESFRLVGGSRAQRDLFEQVLIDAAWRGGRLDTAEALLAQRTAQRPANLWAWKHAAAVLDARGAGAALPARRELERLRAR